LARLCSTN